MLKGALVLLGMGASATVYQKKWGLGGRSSEPTGWLAAFYSVVPLRMMSRLLGSVSEWELPVMLRRPIVGGYSRLTSCDLSELAEPDLAKYKSLGQFFTRRLSNDARPVDPDADLTSPCDGRILHLGEITGPRVEQVKGVDYTLGAFLRNSSDELTPEELLEDGGGTRLYYLNIYLAPNDYHCFHSPADWIVSKRTHIHGELFSVSTYVARAMRGLFSYNERVVYTGRWQHGFFAFCPVGATNVGSIRVDFDESLETNKRRRGRGWRPEIIDLSPQPQLEKGDRIGEFRIGSTIVIIFQGPANLRFTVGPGQSVRVGQRLAFVDHPTAAPLASVAGER